MTDSLTDLEVRAFLDAVYRRYHYDFRNYSMASIKRRLKQAIGAFETRTLAALQERVLREDDFFPRLLRYLTVQVSDMFRDPPFWKVMREQVVPILRTYPSLKVWTAGCSTGEEVYSLAILLREEGLLERTIIYATDINPESLQTAERGIYPIERMAPFTENHRLSGAKASLSDYYSASYGSAVMDRALRKQVVFSDHSLATDNVFAEMHMVLCRNVLIYFDQDLQQRAIGLFHDALIRHGFLGLGSKESLRLTRHRAAFRDFAPEERWFQRL